MTNSALLLKEIQLRYSSQLEETNALIRGQLHSIAPQTEILCNTLDSSRGKQLRPLLTYSIFHGAAPVDPKAAKLAAVFESIHVASLLHDDVIDQCKLRRNVPTINNIYNDGVAILLGDLVFVAIYQLAASMDEIWFVEKVNETVRLLIEGELLQQQQRFKPETAESEYKTIIARKTAALLELCCYASGRFSGMSEENSLKLKGFGRSFGIIFQIVDDWADFCRSRQDDHKDRGVDIANGFITLPWLILLDAADEDEKKTLIEIIGNAEPAGLNQDFIAQLADKYDLPAKMSSRIQALEDECREALQDINGFDCSELLTFLSFVTEEFHNISPDK